jgi:hypothetical protein
MPRASRRVAIYLPVDRGRPRALHLRRAPRERASIVVQQVDDHMLRPYVLCFSDLMGTRFLSSVRFKITIDLVRERHTDPASDHKDPNPKILAPRLLRLSTVPQSG